MFKKFIMGTFLLVLIVMFSGHVFAVPWPSLWSDVDYWHKDSTGDIYFYPGSVGINKSSPDYEADISGDLGVSGKIYASGGIDMTGDLTLQKIKVLTDASVDGTLFVDDIMNYTGNTVAFDTDVLVVDTSDDRVGISRLGIGTNDPSEDLHIYKVGNAIFKMQSTGGNKLTMTMKSATTDWNLIVDDDGGNEFKIDRDNNDYFTINSSGNVGIGTTDPSTDLHVMGNIAIKNGEEINWRNSSGSATLWGIQGNNAYSLWYHNSGSNPGIAIQATTGNVGINETTPDEILHITSTTPYVKIINSTEEDPNYARECRIDFYGEASGGEEIYQARIQACHDGTADDYKGALIFYTHDDSTADAPTEAMKIDSTQGVIFSGNTTMGAIQFPEDGGEITATDMVINDATVDSVHSYSFDIDSEPILVIAGDSSGDTRIKDKRVEVSDDVEVRMSVSAAFRGMRKTVKTVTSNYTMTLLDDVVICNGAAITITLPTVASISDTTGDLTKSPEWRIFNAHANDVTVDAWTTAATTINDASNDAVSQYNGLTIATDGTEYWEIP